MGLTTSEIASRAGIPIRDVAGMELVDTADGTAFLDACSAAGCRILGIEGFRLVGGEAEPDMGAIADFSSLTTAAPSIVEARSFLASIESDQLTFEFTLAQDQE